MLSYQKTFRDSVIDLQGIFACFISGESRYIFFFKKTKHAYIINTSLGREENRLHLKRDYKYISTREKDDIRNRICIIYEDLGSRFWNIDPYLCETFEMSSVKYWSRFILSTFLFCPSLSERGEPFSRSPRIITLNWSTAICAMHCFAF